MILVGVLVGWASTRMPSAMVGGNMWLTRVVGAVGGILGAWLAGSFGSGDAVATAIWAWAGGVVLADLVGAFMPSGS
jgi:uncharacterized membrane protein YeaQ/YmgE (transglycosylase-associated protein family)